MFGKADLLTITLLTMITLLPTGKKQYNLKHYGLPHGNYSGIAKIDEGTYALVSDKKVGDEGSRAQEFKGSRAQEFNVEKTKESVKWIVFDEDRDMEGIAYFPQKKTVFISGEADQRIIEYTLDGTPTGRELKVPEEFGTNHIHSNAGFEALTYNEVTERFWTTTEMPLKEEVYGQQILRLQSFDNDLLPAEQILYRLDDDEVTAKTRMQISGVSDMLALDDGTLIVMERNAVIKRHYWGSYCDTRLYLINPGNTDGNSVVEKTLLYRTKTTLNLGMWLGKEKFANYEGMCLGPVSAEGEQTLLLISDSQGGYKILKDYIKVLKIKQ